MMNEITAVFLMIWILCFIVHVANIGFCVKRWLPMKKGHSDKKPFIKDINRKILWVSTIVSYIAIAFFCLFYDANTMDKAKLFAIILLISPVHPVALALIIEYCYLFHQNKEFGKNKTRE